MKIYIVAAIGETDHHGILKALGSEDQAKDYIRFTAGGWYAPEDLEIIECECQL